MKHWKDYCGLAVCLCAFVGVAAVGFFGNAPKATPSVPSSMTVPLLFDQGLSYPSVAAQAACLIDAQSGAVLFEKNSSVMLPMASTTKIMTALVVLETLPLDAVVTVPAEAVGVEGSSLYLKEGEQLTVETLLYGLLLESGNDAAHTLAVACSGDTRSFAERMNGKAKELGLHSTHFVNPHGLTAEGHYTTAYELARITAEAMKNETFRTIVSTQKKLAPDTQGEQTRVFYNHNKMLRLYKDIVGVKTGYTKAAGRCLVTAASVDEERLFIAVTLNDGADWADHRALHDFAGAHFDTVEIARADSFGVYVNGHRYANPQGIYLTVPRGIRPILRYRCEKDADERLIVRYYAEAAGELGHFYLVPDTSSSG